MENSTSKKKAQKRFPEDVRDEELSPETIARIRLQEREVHYRRSIRRQLAKPNSVAAWLSGGFSSFFSHFGKWMVSGGILTLIAWVYTKLDTTRQIEIGNQRAKAAEISKRNEDINSLETEAKFRLIYWIEQLESGKEKMTWSILNNLFMERQPVFNKKFEAHSMSTLLGEWREVLLFQAKENRDNAAELQKRAALISQVLRTLWISKRDSDLWTPKRDTDANPTHAGVERPSEFLNRTIIKLLWPEERLAVPGS